MGVSEAEGEFLRRRTGRGLNEGFSELGLPFQGPYNKEYSIFGVYIGVPFLGKLPNLVVALQESKADSHYSPSRLMTTGSAKYTKHRSSYQPVWAGMRDG